MSLANFTLIIFSVVLSTLAQLTLKAGANRIRNVAESNLDQASIIVQFFAFMNAHIMAGLCMYVLSAGAWVFVLTKVDISIAYPFISLGFVITLVFGSTLFGEAITPTKVIGTALIIIGCVFIAKA